jgi:glycosyltransferase involved in cell wall biosynthesis
MTDSSLKPQNIPLISVIIPFYNREKFLVESIQSVIDQSFENWELILIDDGSTDRSHEIAESFVQKYPQKISLHSHHKKVNLGASTSRNLGARNSRGEFLTFLDSDDVFFPNTLELEIRAFEKFPDADAVCGTAMVWSSWPDEPSHKDTDFIIDLVLESERIYEPPALFIHNMNASGRKPHFNSTLLRRKLLDQVGLFEEEFKSVGEDQALWAKVSLHGKIYIFDDCLTKYRQHPASTCANLLKDGGDIDNWSAFFNWLEKYLEREDITDQRVWNSFARFKQRQSLEQKLKFVKQFYRDTLPLSWRYKFRDKLTRIKKILAGPSHR